jgi:hypothetical protein
MSSSTPLPDQRLLFALQRLAGDAPLTRRFKPAEWYEITKELGFTDSQRHEAVTSLRTSGFISFTPESTEIIALTSSGITTGNELIVRQQNRDVSDPMPETLEGIRADLDYWDSRLYEGEPGSNWWEQVQARIVSLRHRENRFLTTPISITNNAIGPNSRNNVNSVDQSSNSATEVHAAKAQSATRHSEARRFLAPELQRTIDRVLYIHSRAIANFVSHSVDMTVKPTDLKQDFIPHWPRLYPNAPQVQDLAAEDAAALSIYYDSLHSLNDDVNDWWGREGQLPVNLFNVFLHKASKCLRLALICIEKFDLESLIPPPYESWGTISHRINQALKSEEQVRNAHLERFEANAGK